MRNFYFTTALLINLLMPGMLVSQSISAGDTSKVKVYLAISDRYYSTEQMDSAEYYCMKAGDLARALDYKRGFADFASYYIPVLNRKGEYQKALDVALESLGVSKALGDKSLLAMSYNNIGNQNQYLGDLKSAATNYLNALIFSEGVDTPQRRMRYSNNLASVFLQLEDKSKSYFYAKKSFQLAFDNQDSLGMASSLVNLALSEVMNKKYGEAIRHLDQVLALGKALKDDSYVLDALINKGDVYAEMKKYPAALQLYERSYRVLQDYPVPDYELYVYWGLAQNNYYVGSYEKANSYLVRAIKVAEDLQALHELTKLYLLGSEIHEKTDDNRQALALRKKYEALNDSLVGAETQQNIHKLEIEYQTSQKEKAIADQQLIIAQNNLEMARKDKFIFLWSAIAVLLLSAIAIFILLYRNRQRRNAEKLELLHKQNEVRVLNALVEGEERERSRLARELHDGVGGILSASKMHLSIVQEANKDGRQSDALQNITAMLDHASQEIRAIAHNLFPNLLLTQDLNSALASFCQRMRNSGLDIEYYCLGEMPALGNRFKLMVYRSVQELVNNVMKHAKADYVLVQISHHDNMLSIVVEDNGAGFDLGQPKGMGLLSLEEKIKNLHGRLTIQSAPGHGTSVHLEFDLSTPQELIPIESGTVVTQ